MILFCNHGKKKILPNFTILVHFIFFSHMKLFTLISLVSMAIASNARQGPGGVATRLTYGNQVCIAGHVAAAKAAATSTLDTYRDDHVFAGEKFPGKYFNKKLAFKVATFDKTSRMNLKACGDLCLLDHRVNANGDDQVTDCSGDIDANGVVTDPIGAELCGMTTGIFTPQKRCATFTYDKNRRQCRLYDSTITPSEYNMKTASGKDTDKVNTVAMECSTLSEDDADDIIGWL